MKMEAPGERGCKTTRLFHRQMLCPFPFLTRLALLLLSVVSPARSIHMEYIESHSEFTCEPIRLRMCQDLPYNTTFMPNLLNHYDQQTAALAMEVGLLCVTRSMHVDFINAHIFSC